jgi:DNA-3-methyladenine glycosylase II
VNLTLGVDGPLDVAVTLARYRIWGEDPANRLDEGVFRRVLRIDGRRLPYEVRWEGGVDDARLQISIPGGRGDRMAASVNHEVRRIFGLDFDLPGFYRMAKADPALGPLVEPLYGLRPTLSPDPFEMLVGAIIAQQVNLTFAYTLRARLVRRYGVAATIGRALVYAFPEPSALAQAPVAALREMQFSERKAEYVRGLAQAAAAGGFDFMTMAAADSAATIERLTALRGLGRWTADWFLARCLGRGDVCAAGDLAVGKAFNHYYGRRRPLSEDAIRRRAAGWGTYQNLAVHYLLAGMRRGQPAAGGGT